MKSIHTLIHTLHNPDFAALCIRLALGFVFVHAGWLKLQDMSMTVGGFAMFGIPSWLAYVVAYAEFLCGILAILGIFVRYAGIVLAVIMAVAMWKVHFVNGFGLQNGGYEYVLVLLLVSLVMITLGSGKYSLAALLKRV